MHNPLKSFVPLVLGSACLTGCGTQTTPEAKKPITVQTTQTSSPMELAKPIKSDRELIQEAKGLSDIDKQWLLEQMKKVELEQETARTNSRIFPAQYGKAPDIYMMTTAVIESLSEANDLVKQLKEKEFIDETQAENLLKNLGFRELTSITGEINLDDKSYPEKTYGLYKAKPDSLKAALQAGSKEEALEILKPNL